MALILSNINLITDLKTFEDVTRHCETRFTNPVMSKPGPRKAVTTSPRWERGWDMTGTW